MDQPISWPAGVDPRSGSVYLANPMTSKAESPALIADVGGTYTRLGILTAAGPAHVKVGENAASANLIVLLESYLQTVPASDHPTRGAIAVASPVTGDWVEMTNLNWRFSITDLKSRLKLDPLRVINDFMALALALPHLTADAVVQIGGGKAARGGAVAVVGPGTGLGVSGLLPCDGAHVPITGEGGHVSLAAHDEEEDRVLEWFRRRYGRVSAERVLSGQGLVDLYHCLCGRPLAGGPFRGSYTGNFFLFSWGNSGRYRPHPGRAGRRVPCRRHSAPRARYACILTVSRAV